MLYENRVELKGNVGSEPELRATSGGKSVANFRMATTKKYKDTEKTEWHNIVAFGYAADVVRDYIKKGSRVKVEGSLQTRSWEDKNGQKKYTTEVVAEEVYAIQRAATNATNELTGLEGAAPISDSDVPF